MLRVVLLALLLAGCAGGRREAPLLNINVSSNEPRDEQSVVERQAVEQPPPRVVTRLVPTAPPRVCRCK